MSQKTCSQIQHIDLIKCKCQMQMNVAFIIKYNPFHRDKSFSETLKCPKSCQYGNLEIYKVLWK